MGNKKPYLSTMYISSPRSPSLMISSSTTTCLSVMTLNTFSFCVAVRFWNMKFAASIFDMRAMSLSDCVMRWLR